MGANRACVQVRLGCYDCIHFPETQTCIHIEHPKLDEPLDLILPEMRAAEAYQDSWWDEIVEHALANWLAHNWLSSYRGRAMAFKSLFDANPEIRREFKCACAAQRLHDCEARLERLQREAAELRDVLSTEGSRAKINGKPQAA